MAERGGIQLLPETRKSIEIKTPGENRFLYIGIALSVVIAGLYIGLHFYISSLQDRIAEIQSELVQLEQERDKTMESTLEVTAKRAVLVSGILNNHVYMTQAIDKLANNIQEKIRVKTLSVNVSSGKISVNIEAGTYTAIAKLLATLNADDGVTNALIGSIQPSNSGILSTSVTIDVNAQKYFLKK